MNEICDLPLDRLARLLRRGEASPSEVAEAFLARIQALDGTLNAYIEVISDQARAAARESEKRRNGAELGPLDGVPLALKDLIDVAGVATTNGMEVLRHARAAEDAEVTRRLKAAGAVLLGKLNMHEGALGMTTDNIHFGKCRNPWNTAATPGGSSGGSGAAVAAGLAAGALGSDNMGSIRIPSSFCGIAGLKPSNGLVSTRGMVELSWSTGAVGPMARGVDGLAMLMSVLAGPDPRDPRAQPGNSGFRASAEAPKAPRRVAFSRTLGITPVDPEVAEICAAAARRFEALGATVEEAHPDFSGAHEAFQTLRAVSFATGHAVEFAEHRDKLKSDVIWNIEKGLKLTGEEVARAERLRARLVANMVAFFQTYDLLLAPATIVPPFPVGDRTVTECDGQVFETYIDWLAIVYAVTLTSAPALSLPCGFTRDGLPVGLQMVGPLRSEGPLLSCAAALEAELGLDLGPIDPRAGP